jgi:hypothetical protein
MSGGRRGASEPARARLLRSRQRSRSARFAQLREGAGSSGLARARPN